MLDRRLILLTPLALAASNAARAQPAALTPPMIEGPFYPDAPVEFDNDLVRVRGAAAEAKGRVLRLSGQVWRSVAGQPRPLAGALVEIWQCDANQRYHHPGHWDGPPMDEGFQGYGRMTTGADGRYAFRTIKPVAYDYPLWGRPVKRTPHIHFAVSVGGRRHLTTQMFVAGEPMNDTDSELRRIRDPERRKSVVITLRDGDAIERRALAARFDLFVA